MDLDGDGLTGIPRIQRSITLAGVEALQQKILKILIRIGIRMPVDSFKTINGNLMDVAISFRHGYDGLIDSYCKLRWGNLNQFNPRVADDAKAIRIVMV